MLNSEFLLLFFICWWCDTQMHRRKCYKQNSVCASAHRCHASVFACQILGSCANVADRKFHFLSTDAVALHACFISSIMWFFQVPPPSDADWWRVAHLNEMNKSRMRCDFTVQTKVTVKSQSQGHLPWLWFWPEGRHVQTEMLQHWDCQWPATAGRSSVWSPVSSVHMTLGHISGLYEPWDSKEWRSKVVDHNLRSRTRN